MTKPLVAVSAAPVDIVLATYNGQRYVRQQLDSLLNQSVRNVRILIGDDGSSDGTLGLLTQYAETFSDRVALLPTKGRCGGASANFSRLLLATDAPYVFLCDQDDVWDEGKVAVSLKCIRDLEDQFGTDVPMLVHTDLRVVDQNLVTLSASFFKFQHLDAQAASLKQLLVQNMVTGCAVVVNRALLNKALPVPADAIMHDWWLALVAAAFGKIGFVDRATMSYRQHGSNTVGAKGWTMAFIASRLKQLISGVGAGELLRPGIKQAQAFLQRYKRCLSAEQLVEVDTMAHMQDKTGVGRVMSAAKLGLRKQGVTRTFGYYWVLLTARF